ncbi:MAG: 30S ribosomal protein S20 [Puniceicoccales bacterium]|jgi:small subunit ribosomal protein S20|nr:30S ribosomal protein S20 [Puniceicoccales bacterium]
MANKKAARKSVIQTISHTMRNKVVRSRLKTLSRKAFALAGTDLNVAKSVAREYVSELDKAVKKSVIHRNAADRKKSSLSRIIFS